MTPPADLHLHLTSDARQLGPVRDSIREWVAAQGWNEMRVADVVLAADEALTNVIRHGYQNEPGKPIDIWLRTMSGPDGGIEIEIRDFGRQVPLDCICGRDLDEPRPGGLGVHLIRSLMDEAVYSHAEGGGMRLIMRKHAKGCA
ncbi:MAG: ATP-binding protein [Phycisphaerales bacterium]|nr:ATP-binding protein [Phycisphaerales bacterium]